MTGFQKRLWLGLAIMAALTPIGIILPKMMGGGDAWGEWGTDKIREMLGYVPKGLERLSNLWSAPLPDYSTGGGSSPAMTYIIYIASGLLGIGLAWLVVYLITKFLIKRNTND